MQGEHETAHDPSQPQTQDQQRHERLEAALTLFFTREHNPQREGDKLREETVESHLQRLRQFRRFLSSSSGSSGLTQGRGQSGDSQQSLGDDVARACLDTRKVTAWLDELQEGGRNAGTRARACDALLLLLKYLAAAGLPPGSTPPPLTAQPTGAATAPPPTAAQPSSSAATTTVRARAQAALAEVRRVRNALQRSYEVDLRGRSDRQSREDSGKWASWPELVEAGRLLVREWRDLQSRDTLDRSGDPDWLTTGPFEHRLARSAQDALLALFYLVIPPGRGLEYRTLELAPQDNARPEDGRNLLTRDGDGRWVLRLTRYKTSARMGRQEVPLPEDEQLHDIIAAATSPRTRRALGSRANHSFLFCRPGDGDPFRTSSDWYSALTALFGRALEECTGEKATISVNALRHAYVTATYASSSLQEREASAAAMRHTVGTAGRIYDASTSRDRVEAAVSMTLKLWTGDRQEGGGPAASAASAAPVASSVGGKQRRQQPPRTLTAAPVIVVPDSEEEEEASPDEEEESDNQDEDQTYTVERLLQFRTRLGVPEYWVKWQGFPSSENSWEPEDAMPPSTVREFWRRSAPAGGGGGKRARRSSLQNWP